MSRLHTKFVEVKVHTAKCDSCETHNKGTLYRCTECGQHVCSFCWTVQSGDKTHVYGSGSHDVPQSNAKRLVEGDIDDEDGEQEDEKGGTRQARMRRKVVVSDDEDDDLPMLTPAPTTNQAEVNGTNNQHRDRRNIIIDNDQREDRQDDLPTLGPIAQARKLQVLRPADPTANTSVNETVDQVGQSHSHIHGQKFRAGRLKLIQDHDNLERQAAPTRYASVGDQELTRQARLPKSSRVPYQQAPHPTPLHAQPASYHHRPREDLDQQAARNQYAFANIQPRQRQVPDPAHSSNAHQRATQLALRQTQPASYRPRPGIDVHQQAARGQFGSADRQDLDHQNRMPNQASYSRQDAVHLDPRPAQVSISRQNAQIAANIDAVAAHNRRAFLINQQAQAHASAMSMEARNRQAMGVYRSLPPNTHRDQVSARNRQAFASKQQSPSTGTSMEQKMEARDQQEADLSRKQANRPHPGPTQTSYQYQGPTKSFPLPPQVSVVQQHAALLASRQAPNPTAIQSHPKRRSGIDQVREHSPGILAAADALLAYARIDQDSGAYNHPDQDMTAVSPLVIAAGQLSKASSVSSKSRASSKTLTGGSGAAGIYHVSGPVLSSCPPSADADSANARLEKHRDRQAGLYESSGTHKPVSDPSVSPRGHPSYSHAGLQPHSRSALADSSAAQSPKLSVSNHAATYLSQWNSGRAAHSLSPSSQLYTTCSSSPALHASSTPGIQDINVGASDSREAAEARTKAPSGPDCALGGPSDIDIVITSPDVEEDESRRSEASALENMPRMPREDGGSEETRFPGPIPGLLAKGRAKKHQRDEKKADRKVSKERKASGDVDVVDARGRSSKDKHSEQIDDDGGDIKTTSRNKLDSSRTTKNQGQANAVAKGLEYVGNYKKGVAYVKKPKPKSRKGKKPARHIG